MNAVKGTRVFAMVLGILATTALPAGAQITTGTVTGTVIDAQGGVIPGATVTLVSETQGTKSTPAVTNATGDFVFPNVTADTGKARAEPVRSASPAPGRTTTGCGNVIISPEPIAAAT